MSVSGVMRGRMQRTCGHNLSTITEKGERTSL